MNIEKQNLETYKRWKSELEEKGKTPSDMVQFCRTMGQGDYADQVEDLIQRMERIIENNRLFHPSVDVLRVDGKDTKHLEMAMLMLHDIGWLIQQCGIDVAVSRLREYYEAAPDSVIFGCAHGAAAIHGILGRTTEVP